jgi:chemotaxis protein methyltransferase CheR
VRGAGRAAVTNSLAGNAALAGIAALVRRETGIALTAAREAALRAAMERAAHGLDPGAFLRAASDAGGDRALLDRLIDEVTVQETTFVRDRRQLDAVAWPSHFQAARAAGSDTIRVWSAGCASGEEAYTLALLAAEALAPAAATVDVLGTDVSGAALAAATAGRYRERAVRGLEPALRARYLERQPDGSYLVRERLRRLVRFRRHNLAGDPIPPHGEAGFDVVVCRNVLIYFEAPLATRVIGQLERSLRPGGVLLLGAVDGLQRTSAPSVRPVRPVALAGPRAEARAPAETWPRAALLASDPFDADAHYVQGLVALAGGEPVRAVAAFRRALCTDAAFTLAAFALGRGYDALGDGPAARRAYEQALRTLDPEDHRHQAMLQQVDIGDIAAACRARLAAYP